MKKTIAALAVALALSGFAKAENTLSTTVIGASNYLFRAMSYNSQGAAHQGQGSPVVQGSVDFAHIFGNGSSFGTSFFSGPADTFNTQALYLEKDTELDTFLSFTQPITENSVVTVGYNYYSFMKNVDNDMGEIAASLAYRKLKLSHGYTEHFSGVDTNQNRTLLTFSPEVYSITTTAGANSINLDLRVAYNSFSNPYAVATSSYYDYVAGLVFNVDGLTAGIAYTNTFNRTNLITNEYAKNTDGTFTVSFSKTLKVF